MKDIKHLKVLFVEDEKLAREKLASVLSKIFDTVVTASNGKEAFEMYQKALFSNPFDLIVSDINMPIMNGIEMLENIRATNDNIPIIFTTARNESEYLIKAIELNANYYLIKPIDLSSLISNVKIVCDKTLLKRSLEIRNNEMRNLIDALDKFSAVCRFDIKGNFTYANDIFEKQSKYSKEELSKLNLNDLICNDVNKLNVSSLWKNIKNGNQWRGTIRKIAKDNSDYFVNNFIMPIYDESDSIVREYISIEYSVTDDEKKKKHLQSKLYQTLQVIKQKEIDNKKELEKMKQMYNSNSVNNQFDTAKVRTLIAKIKSLQNQIVFTEEEIKKIKSEKDNIVSKANLKVNHIMDNNISIKKELKNTKKSRDLFSEKNVEAQKKIDELEDRIKDKNKRIEYLLDVIKVREKK